MGKLDQSIESHMVAINKTNDEIINDQYKIIDQIQEWELAVIIDIKYAIAQLLLSHVFGDKQLYYFINRLNSNKGYYIKKLYDITDNNTIYDEIDSVLEEAQKLIIEVFNGKKTISPSLEYLNTTTFGKYSKFIDQYNKHTISSFNTRRKMCSYAAGGLMYKCFWMRNANNKFEDFKNILNVYKKINDMKFFI